MKLAYIQLNNKKYLATKNKIHNFVVKFNKQMYLQKKSIKNDTKNYSSVVRGYN
jgi:uncharacterized protein YjaZ